MCIENYIRVVEEMLTRGERVTLQSVRQAAGKGSYTTISEAIRLVLNRGLVPTEVSGPVPESLVEQARDLWQEACRLASAAVASERLALHSARIDTQENLRELMGLADGLSKQLEDMTAQVEDLKAERDDAERRAAIADTSVKAMKQVLKELGLKPGKATREAQPSPDEATEA